MARRSTKPKEDIEVVESVETVESKIEEVIEEPIVEAEVEETSIETPVEEVVEEPKPKKSNKREAKKAEEVVEAPVAEPKVVEDTTPKTLVVRDLTILYRDVNLSYPLARIHGVAELIDVCGTYALYVKAHVNSHIVAGYIKREDIK